MISPDVHINAIYGQVVVGKAYVSNFLNNSRVSQNKKGPTRLALAPSSA